ncbi:PIN domain-containing protein [archaeon]|nr:PIN domain-containing protein [archaeon]
MNKFVIDSWAWIEYLNGTQRGLKAREIIQKSDNEIFTNVISLSEIISVAKRKNMDIDTAEEAVLSNSEIIGIDQDTARETGLLHAQTRKSIRDFGLGDAFVLFAARKINARILTGDPHFKGFKETVFI